MATDIPPVEFRADIKRLEGKIKWNVIYFPHSAQEVFGTKGKVPVSITVDGHSFDHTLLPSRNGHYFVYNRAIGEAVGKKQGDGVLVTVCRRERPRDVVVPGFLSEALAAANVVETFL